MKGGFLNRVRPDGTSYVVALDIETGLEPPLPQPELRFEGGALVEMTGEGPYRLARGPGGWTLRLGSTLFELRGRFELLQVMNLRADAQEESDQETRVPGATGRIAAGVGPGPQNGQEAARAQDR